MGASATTVAKQYLTCKLGEEVFALEITKVREVLEFMTVTKVPRAPDFIRGVINLRGSVVPVVDLRMTFGMSKAERTLSTCVIIAEMTVNGETTVLGAVADSVQEVVALGPDRIEPAPKIGSRLVNEFIVGMGKLNGRFIIILDVDKLFSAEEAVLVRAAEQEGHESAPTA